MPAYIPPHKLRQAAGGAATGTAADDTPPSNTSPTATTRFSTRGGGRAGFNGQRYGRGGGRGWSSRPPPVDPSEMYRYSDIEHYFWPDSQDLTARGKTFHDSASHADQLTHIMLFLDANPRWGSDQIVFAKSSLRLLPDYRSQTAGKEEYFPLPAIRGRRMRGESELSQAQDGIPSTTSSAEEGLAVNESTSLEAPEGRETQPDSVTGPHENNMSQHGEEAASSSTQHTPDDNDETAAGSHHNPKSMGQTPQLVSIPPMDYVPSQHAPIAVFEEIINGHFKFAGWYSVARVSILAPHSQDLVRMLQQKWERKDRYGNVIPRQRDPSAWRSSLNYQWAVVKFEKLTQDVAPAAPIIEKLPASPTFGSEWDGRGVREMLNELRVKDDEGHKVTEQGESSPSRLSGETPKRDNFPVPEE